TQGALPPEADGAGMRSRKRQPTVRKSRPALLNTEEAGFSFMTEIAAQQDRFGPPQAEDRPARTAALLDALDQRVLVLDGATRTALQALRLRAEDFGGEAYEGCNEHLCATRPDAVDHVHEGYLAAGCDIVETDTFGATPLVLAEYGL